MMNTGTAQMDRTASNLRLNNKTDLVLALLYAGDTSQTQGRQTSAPVEGITRLEKLLFLAKIEFGLLKNVSHEQDFHFVPFRMGPWTQEVYDEVDFLESIGLLRKKAQAGISLEDEAHNDQLFSDLMLDKYQRGTPSDDATDSFDLTDAGREKARKLWDRLDAAEKEKLASLKRRFNTMNLKQFLRYVYQKYPEYTEESEIKQYLNL